MMDDKQRRDAAEKLIEAVKNNTKNAFDNWNKLHEANVAAHAKWVKETLGLDHEPTREDLEGMHEHAKTALVDKVRAMRADKPSTAVVAGVCIAEDIKD
jgi:hypothetical protein